MIIVVPINEIYKNDRAECKYNAWAGALNRLDIVVA